MSFFFTSSIRIEVFLVLDCVWLVPCLLCLPYSGECGQLRLLAGHLSEDVPCILEQFCST